MVRRLFAGYSTTGSNRVFMEMPKELEKDEDPAEAVRRVLSKNKTGARVWPDDDAVREAIRTRPFYKAGRGNQRFQVLRRLEESYGASEPVDYAKARLTVEHVLPQNPAHQWFDLLAEEAEDGQGPDELHALLVHTLGNLTLSADNAKLSNHPFRRKQEILDSSALRMNQEIAGRERWGRAEILDRAAGLADRAVRLWPGPVAGTVPEDDEWSGWKELRSALLAMPAGTWTTYGDVAALIGTHAVPVGQHLASKAGLHGAYRVLTADGRVSEGFRWPDGQESGDARTRLEAEGVPFDDAGRARRSHRLTTADLAALLGRETAEEAVPSPGTEARAALGGRPVRSAAARQPDQGDRRRRSGRAPLLGTAGRPPRLRPGERDELLPHGAVRRHARHPRAVATRRSTRSPGRSKSSSSI